MYLSPSGFCQNCGSTSMTTWYWFSCVYIVETGPLAEGVVERVVDHLRRDAEARRGAPVDRERRLEALVLLVAVDVGQLLQGFSALEDPRRPLEELRRVVALQRVLVLRAAAAAADPQVLDRLQEERGAGDVASLPRRRAITWSALTFRCSIGFKADEHPPGVRRCRPRGTRSRSRRPGPS